MVKDAIIQGDCIEWLGRQAKPFADLIFADPPFNIGYKYDVYEDRKKYDDYYKWTKAWMAGCKQVLRPSGSFWVAIGDDYAAEVRMIGRELGLHLRNWVIWHYTFGQQTKMKFARSHTHLFYFVNDPRNFTFNDKAVRTFSDRQREYYDARANKDGKLPDDVWTEFPRVCGTFGERLQWHPCQMPEALLTRIIRACSNPGDLVFDPFSGSGTTVVAAKKLSRHYAGTELSKDYALNTKKRLAETVSLSSDAANGNGRWPKSHEEELLAAYLQAAVPTWLLARHPHLLDAFVQHFNWRMELGGCDSRYDGDEILQTLAALKKENRLGRIRIHANEAAGEPNAKSKRGRCRGG